MDRQNQAIQPEHVALTECDMQGSQAVAGRDQSLWSYQHLDCVCCVGERASRRKITEKGGKYHRKEGGSLTAARGTVQRMYKPDPI